MLSEERMELGMYGVLYFLERNKCLFVSSFLFYIYKRNTQFHIVIVVFKFFFLYLENKHIWSWRGWKDELFSLKIRCRNKKKNPQKVTKCWKLYMTCNTLKWIIPKLIIYFLKSYIFLLYKNSIKFTSLLR